MIPFFVKINNIILIFTRTWINITITGAVIAGAWFRAEGAACTQKYTTRKESGEWGVPTSEQE